MGYETDIALANQAAQTAVQAGGVIAQGKLNKKTREWNERMLKQQREWNLADWQMQNEYNHPSAQMERLRASGLNPNLVYGKGTDVSSGDIGKTSLPSWNPKAPDVSGLANSLFSGYDLALKQAQVDNMRTQNTVMLQDKLLKEAQTIGTLTNAAKTKQDQEQAASLFPGTLDGQRLLNEQTNARTGIMLQENERAALASAQSLSKGLEEILSIRQSRAKTSEEIENLRIARQILHHDERIKALDARLADNNIRPGDGWQENVAKQILDWLLSPSAKDGKMFPEGVYKQGQKAKEYFSPKEYFKRFLTD